MALGFNKHFGGRRGGKRNVPFYSGCVANLKKKSNDLQAENTRLRKALGRMVKDANSNNERLVSRAAIIQGENTLTQKGGNNEGP